MAVALLAVVVFLALPGWLVGLFLDPSDPQRGEVLAVGVVLMAAAALFQLVDAAQVIALGLLRGVRMLATGVHAQIRQLPAAQPRLGQHALDGP